jgi:hypothetical protein
MNEWERNPGLRPYNRPWKTEDDTITFERENTKIMKKFLDEEQNFFGGLISTILIILFLLGITYVYSMCTKST